jgi:hypothetical protein
MKQKRTMYRRNGNVVWGRYNARRKPGHDYRSNGYYFVTLNTKHRLPIFGEAVCGNMQLCRTGAMVWQCWNDIPLHFPFVRGWKVGVRNRMKAAGIDFALWQRGFHDRIISSDEGLWRTRRYIRDNPKKYNRKKRSSVGAKNLSPRLMTNRQQKPSTQTG